MMNTKYICLFLITLSLMIGYSSDSLAQSSVVVPNALTNTQGTEAGTFPLLCGFAPSSRYQQIFAAEQINISGQILAMKFRRSPEGNPNGLGLVTIPNVQIAMSVTQVQPENPSNTFADNLGPTVETVFDGDLTINVPTCTITPCPFETIVPLEVPFEYNPSEGNLIVDWTVPTCIDSQERQFDTTPATITPTTVMERIFTGPGSNVNSPTGTIGTDTMGDEIGLVTQFVIDEARNVPTLSQWGLIATAGLLGIIGFIVIRRRQFIATNN